MSKKIKITYLVLAALSFMVLMLALVVGILFYRDVSSYYSYLGYPDYKWDTAYIKHTHEGSIAIVGACLLLFAIVFYVVTAVGRDKRAHLFPIGSSIALLVSSIMQFVATKRYFSSTSSIERVFSRDINVTFCNVLLTSGILCIVLLITTIVLLTINAVASTKSRHVVATSTYCHTSHPQSTPIVKKPSVSYEDGITQITYFYELYSAGILTEQEFADQKTRIFSNMGIDKITGEDL